MGEERQNNVMEHKAPALIWAISTLYLNIMGMHFKIITNLKCVVNFQNQVCPGKVNWWDRWISLKAIIQLLCTAEVETVV